MGEERKLYKVLVGKPEGKIPLGRPRRMWEDGIRMDLREIGLRVWTGFDWLRTVTGGGLCEYGDETSGSCATELVSLIAVSTCTKGKLIPYQTDVKIRNDSITDEHRAKYSGP
jgi:hypothetical protein